MLGKVLWEKSGNYLRCETETHSNQIVNIIIIWYEDNHELTIGVSVLTRLRQWNGWPPEHNKPTITGNDFPQPEAIVGSDLCLNAKHLADC